MIFQFLILNALFILGLHQITRDGYIFDFVENWVTDDMAEDYWWSKPVLQCPVCMSSVWGIGGFIFFHLVFGLPFDWIYIYPFTLAGIISAWNQFNDR